MPALVARAALARGTSPCPRRTASLRRRSVEGIRNSGELDYPKCLWRFHTSLWCGLLPDRPMVCSVAESGCCATFSEAPAVVPPSGAAWPVASCAPRRRPHSRRSQALQDGTHTDRRSSQAFSRKSGCGQFRIRCMSPPTDRGPESLDANRPADRPGPCVSVSRPGGNRWRPQVVRLRCVSCLRRRDVGGNSRRGGNSNRHTSIPANPRKCVCVPCICSGSHQQR